MDGEVVIVGNTTLNSTRFFSCNNGFRLVGNDTVICEDSEDWNSEDPVCSGKPLFSDCFSAL